MNHIGQLIDQNFSSLEAAHQRRVDDDADYEYRVDDETDNILKDADLLDQALGEFDELRELMNESIVKLCGVAGSQDIDDVIEQAIGVIDAARQVAEAYAAQRVSRNID